MDNGDCAVKSAAMSYSSSLNADSVQHIQREFSMEETQPTKANRRPLQRKRKSAVTLGMVLGVILGIYLIFPGRINVLVLGIDRTPQGSAAGRSDTLILTSARPFSGYFGMLSIPRDLWVNIPGYGENRLNAAHFFAEAEVAGSGPEASMVTITQNFGIDLQYYLRFRFDGFQAFVDALGGVPLKLESPVGKLPIGDNHLNGEQALAFVRDRSSGDDFTRMNQGQIFMRAILKHMINPLTWPRLPRAMTQLATAVDSNLPIWIWPRFAFALIRTGPSGLDARVISRDMVTGFTTSGGAQVLAPNWSRINPLLLEMFGQ